MKTEVDKAAEPGLEEEVQRAVSILQLKIEPLILSQKSAPEQEKVLSEPKVVKPRIPIKEKWRRCLKSFEHSI